MRRTPLTLTAALTALAALATACGDDSNTASIAALRDDGARSTTDNTRTVEVAMEDIRFSETSMDVARGTTVVFRFDNVGVLPHDAIVGDLEAQLEHEAEMAEAAEAAAADPGHDDSHDEDEPALLLQPGEAGELTYTFDEPGNFEIGCHQPGHYAAGMKMAITVL